MGATDGIYLYRMERFEEIWFRATSSPVISVEWLTNDHELATLAGDEVSIWDASTGSLLHAAILPCTATVGAFNPIASIVAVNAPNPSDVESWNDLYLLEMRTGQVLHTLDPGKDVSPVETVVWSSDGSTLAAAYGSGVILWDTETGNEIRRLRGLPLDRPFMISSLAFSPDDTRLAAGAFQATEFSESSSGAVVIWDIGTSGLPIIWELANPLRHEVAWSPDGQTLVYSAGGQVIVRAVLSGEPLQSFGGSGSLKFVSNGEALMITMLDMITLLDLRTGGVLQTLGGHSFSVYEVQFSPDGLTLASGSISHANLWDVGTGAWLRAIAPGYWVREIAWLPDGKTLATGSANPILWDVRTGEQQYSLNTGEASTMAGWPVALSPDGTVLAGGSDRLVTLWASQTGNQLRALQVDGPVSGLAWSPDGRTLAAAWAGDWSGGIVIWDIQAGLALQTLGQNQQGGVTDLAWSPRGDMIAAIEDGRLALWDVETGRSLQLLQGVDAYVSWSVAFSPDGNILAAGGEKVILWDTHTGQEVGSLEVDGTAYALDFSPDGSWLAIGCSPSDKGGVFLWAVMP